MCSLAASLAKAVASECYRTVALQTLQIHGGIGFTWEHPIHLYAKRAKSTQATVRSPAVIARASLNSWASTAARPRSTPTAPAGDDVAPNCDTGDAAELARRLPSSSASVWSPRPATAPGDRLRRAARFRRRSRNRRACQRVLVVEVSTRHANGLSRRRSAPPGPTAMRVATRSDFGDGASHDCRVGNAGAEGPVPTSVLLRGGGPVASCSRSPGPVQIWPPLSTTESRARR